MVLSLVLMSFLIRMRMGGYGRPAREIGIAIGELWLTFGAIAAVLWAAGRLLGEPTALNAEGEVRELGRRFADLDGGARLWVLAGAALAVLLFVRLVSLLRRYMEEPAESGGSE